MSWIISAGILVGLIDVLIGNKMKLGDRFLEGFRLTGGMMMSIPGITAFAPVVANLIRPFVAPAFSAVGIDPGILGMILCADMGGYQLGLSLAQDKTIGILGGVLIACMFGGTICWTLPLGHSLVNVKYHNYFFRGILLGMLAIPVGSFIGGLMLGIPVGTLLWNMIPLWIVIAIIAAGLKWAPNGSIRFMAGLGKVMEWIGLIGVAIGGITYLTGIEIIPGLTPIMDTMAIVCGMVLTLIGMFPLLALFNRAFEPVFQKIGRKVGMDSLGCSSLIFTLGSNAPVFSSMNEMNKRSIVINSAWMVTASAMFGSQLGFIMTVGKEYVPVLFVSKMSASILALVFSVWRSRNLS